MWAVINSQTKEVVEEHENYAQAETAATVYTMRDNIKHEIVLLDSKGDSVLEYGAVAIPDEDQKKTLGKKKEQLYGRIADHIIAHTSLKDNEKSMIIKVLENELKEYHIIRGTLIE